MNKQKKKAVCSTSCSLPEAPWAIFMIKSKICHRLSGQEDLRSMLQVRKRIILNTVSQFSFDSCVIHGALSHNFSYLDK